MLNSSMSLKLVGILLIAMIIIQYIPHSVYSVNVNPYLSENLTIDQIYDYSVLVVKVNSTNSVDVLNITNYFGNYINSYVLIVSNLNLNNQTLSWFISRNPQLNYVDFLSEKGLILVINYSLINSNITRQIINYVDSSLETNFIEIENKSSTSVYVAPANYFAYMNYFIKKLKNYDNGFLNITNKLSPSLLIYEYQKEGVMKITSVAIVRNLNSTLISTQGNFIINYTKFLGNITPSPFSTSSLIKLNLYGMLVISSNPRINFVNSYSNGYVSSGEISLSGNEVLRNFYLNASLLNPFITVEQIAKPAITNSTFNLLVTLRNIGTLKANNITVRLNLPTNFIGPNIMNFEQVLPSSSITKNVTLTIKGNGSQIYYIPPPIATFKVGLTSLSFIGNPIYVAFNKSKFASLAFSIISANYAYLTSIRNNFSFQLNITNIGNLQANNVSIQIDYYRSFIKSLNSSQSIVTNITLYFDRFNSLPNNSSLFNSISITYLSGNTTYSLNYNGSLFNSMFNYGYTTYASFVPYPLSSTFSSNFNLTYVYNVIGGSGNLTVKIPLNALRNIKIISPSNLPIYNMSYNLSFSLIGGSRSSVTLGFKANSTDTFYLTPIFEKVRNLKPPILVPIAVFSNAINISRIFNTTTIQLGKILKEEIKVENLGSTPVYNLNISSTFYKGWQIIQGSKSDFLKILVPSSTYSFVLIINASEPSTPYIPATYLIFEIGNLTFSQSTTSNYIKVLMQFNINAVNIYSQNLENFTVSIYSLNNTILANISTINGVAVWNGYIGSFDIQIQYKNVTVYNSELNLTAYNSTIVLKTNVTSFEITLIDSFGQQIGNANIFIEGPFIQQAEKSSLGTYLLSNIPFGSYTINIQIEGKKYSIPIMIQYYTPKQIKVSLPVISLAGYALSVQILSLIVIFAFIIITIISLVNLRKKRRFLPASRK